MSQSEASVRKFYQDLGNTDAYPADLYKPDGVGEVLACPGAVNDEAIEHYKREGYLAVADVYSLSQVQDAKDALTDLVAGRNKSFNGLHLESAANKYAQEDDQKTIQNNPAAIEAIVRKVTSFTQFDTRLKAMADHPALQQIIAKLMGEAVVMTQEMALLKPPGGREKPWHQDHAYFNLDASKVHVVGVWIALDQATIANGCMHIMPAKHHKPILHFQRRDWQICDSTSMQLADRCLAVPLEPGGVLFFDSFLPHGTPTNVTNQRRRALQFHYKAASVTEIQSEDRMAVWGSEGKDVTC